MNRNKILMLLACSLLAMDLSAQNKVDTRVHIFDNNVRSLNVCSASAHDEWPGSVDCEF